MRALAVALAGVLALALPAAAQTAAPPTLTVSGQGSAAAVPDLARLGIAVETRARRAGVALSDNNEAMRAVFGVLEATGIASPDITTSGFSVIPLRPRRAEPEGQIDAFQVVNSVEVTLRDLDRLGGLLDALIEAGANRISGPSFGFSDPASLAEQARGDAVRNARRAAEVYADAAGLALGPVLSMREGGSVGPVFEARAMVADAGVPIARGESAVTASVTMVFALEAR
ncbi:MAG: SIMPL domain-containing protein [Pseudomonadota bacterium]